MEFDYDVGAMFACQPLGAFFCTSKAKEGTWKTRGIDGVPTPWWRATVPFARARVCVCVCG